MEQSKKLMAEEADARPHYLERSEDEALDDAVAQAVEEEVVLIKPLETYNNYVMVMQDEQKVSCNLQIKGDDKLLPEGIVVGVPAPGNGLPDGAGGRLYSQVAIGTRVKIFTKQAVERVVPQAGHYEGRTLTLLPETAVLYRLPDCRWALVGDEDETGGGVADEVEG